MKKYERQIMKQGMMPCTPHGLDSEENRRQKAWIKIVRVMQRFFYRFCIEIMLGNKKKSSK